MADIERIKKLLVHIPDHTRVAHLAGVDVSYISQLMADEVFKEAVMAERIMAGEAKVRMDDSADSIEQLLLDKLKRALPMMVKPMEILRAYEVINKAKRKVDTGSMGSSAEGGTVLSLRIPKHTALRFRMDTKGEVIEVEGKPLVTMPSTGLLKLMNERGSEYGHELEALGNRLAAYSETQESARAAAAATSAGGTGIDADG